MNRNTKTILLLIGAAVAAIMPAALAGSPMQADGEQALAARDYLKALPLLQQAAEFEKANKEAWTALRAKIEECKTHLTAEQITKVSWSVGVAPPSATPATVRVPHDPPKPGEVRTLGIKELGNFEYDPEKAGGVPADVLKLDGLKVNMWGFMIPSLQADQVTEFILVPSLTGCCYGQPPGVQHSILVHAEKLPVAYTTKPIRVIGTLRVKEDRDADYTVGIFAIVPESITMVDVAIPGDVLQGKKQMDLQGQK